MPCVPPICPLAQCPVCLLQPLTQCPVCPHSPLIQFNLLHSKFHLCSVPTRALLLSTYIKFVNLFPEVKATIQDVLRSDSQLRNADVELQQRAVEYLRLSTVASTDILVGPGCPVPLLRCPGSRAWKPRGSEPWRPGLLSPGHRAGGDAAVSGA